MIYNTVATPYASVEALLLTPSADDFQTVSMSQLEFSLSPNGIVGDERHRGNITAADVRVKRVYERGAEVLNRQSVSFVGAEDLDYIGDELELCPDAIHQAMAVDLSTSVTPAQSRRLFLASCLGANILLGKYEGTEEFPEFCRIARGLDVGPFDSKTDRFTSAAIAITRPNGPCAVPGKKIKNNYPEILPDSTTRDFIRIAEGRRGFVGMVVKPGEIAVGDVVQFVPLGA